MKNCTINGQEVDIKRVIDEAIDWFDFDGSYRQVHDDDDEPFVIEYDYIIEQALAEKK